MPDLDNEMAVLWKDLLPHKALVHGPEEPSERIFDRSRVGEIEDRISSLWMRTADLVHRSFLRFARVRTSLDDICVFMDEVIEVLSAHLMQAGPGSNPTGILLGSITEGIKRLHTLNRAGDIPYEMRLIVLDRAFKIGRMLNGLGSMTHIDPVKDQLLLVIKELRNDMDFKDVVESTPGGVMDLIDSGGNTARRDMDLDLMIKDLYSCRIPASRMESDIQIDLYRIIPVLKEIMDISADALDADRDIESISCSMGLERRLTGDPITHVQDIRFELGRFVESSIMDIPRTSSLRIVEAPGYLSPLVSDGLMFDQNGLTGDPGSVLYLPSSVKDRGRMTLPGTILMLIRSDLGSRTHYINTFKKTTGDREVLDLLERHQFGYGDFGFRSIVEDQILLSMRGDASWLRGMIPEGSLKEGYGEEKLLGDLMFLSTRDRVMSIISALCDLRVNSGSITLPDFIRWVHIITGIEFGTLFPVCLEALTNPGACSTSYRSYRELKEIQDRWHVMDRSSRDFFRTSSSLGYSEMWRYRELMDV